MRVAMRVLLVLLVFAGVGWGTMHLLVARAVARGTPEVAVRLGGAMGGLFVGGVAATLVALVVLLGGRRRREDPEDGA